MKKYYCIVLILIIFGLIMGYLCLPGTTDTALMHYESSNYHAAIDSYKNYIDKTGDITSEIIVNLSKLYIKTGEPEKAISLIQSYVLKAPDSLEAKKLLRDYFKSAHKTADLIQITEEIAKINPNADVYKILFELYNTKGHINKIAETINKMIVQKEYKVNEKDFRALIYYYASKNDINNAEKIIDTLLSKKDYEIQEASTYNLIINVLLDNKKISKAYKLAQNFCKNDFTLDQKIQLASEFKRKEPKKTLSLLLELKGDNNNNEQLQFVIMDTKLILNRKKEVLKELFKLEAEDNLTGNLLDLYFSLLIESKDKTAIEKAIKKYNLAELSDDNLIFLASYLLINNNRNSANILASKLGNDFLYDYPLLNLILTSTQYNKNISYVVNNILDKNYYLPTDLALMYADALYNINDTIQCEKILAKIPLERICSEFNSEAFVQTAFKTNKLKGYLNNLSLLIANNNNKRKYEVCEAYLSFLIACEETERFPEILYSLKDSNHYFKLLESSFITSQSFGKSNIALELAGVMNSIDNSRKSKLYLIEAYLMNNMYKEAEEIFKPFEIEDKETALLYLNILAQTSEFKNGFYKNLSSKSQKALNLILTNNPSDDELRTVAYFYTSTDNTEEAIDIFFNLSKNNKYNSTDTEQVIALCKKTNNKQVSDWVTNKAYTETNIMEKNYWLNALNEIGKSKTVIIILEPTFKTGNSSIDKIDFQYLKNTYLQALYLQAEYRPLIKELNKIIVKDYQFSPVEINIDTFSILIKGGFYTKAYDILGHISYNDALTKLDPIQIARVFIKNDKTKEGLDYLQEFKSTEFEINNRINEAVLLLCAASGNHTPIIEWIEKQEKCNETLLSDFFYTAINNNQKNTAYLIAQRAYTKAPTQLMKTIYLDALNTAGKYDEILTIITFPSGTEETEKYLFAVNNLIKNNERIGNNILNTLNLLYYRFIDNSINSSKEQKRTLGYILSDLNQRKKAKEIFFQLAKDQSVYSPDVEQFLFLIGNKTNQREKEWLITRAESSYGKSMLKWCKYLNQTNNPEYTIKLMEKNGILEN